MVKVVIPQEVIQNAIYFINGQRVMLDSDLAKLYAVSTGNLNKAVKRNIERFPKDFMFQLTDEEWEVLVFQNGISKLPSVQDEHKTQHGGRRTNPYVFTEHGVLMLANVLNSKRAITVSIQIVRAFTQLRQLLSTHEELRQKVEALEARYDEQFAVVFNAIRQLMQPPDEQRRQIGFQTE